MSSLSFGSASASLPENLGVGSAAKTQGPTKAQALSVKDQADLDQHLATIKQLLATESPPAKKALEGLSAYTKELIEEPNKESVVATLISMMKSNGAGKPALTADDYAVNAFGLFIEVMRKDHLQCAIIGEKFKNQARLTYGECRTIDTITTYARFPMGMAKAGILDNPHINRSVQITDLANKYAFSDFQDGDVLFYDLAGRMHYQGPGPGFLEKITMKALGTNYAHVGVFYRSADGEPYVVQVQGKYERRRLYFGQMSFIKGKRVNPAKFAGVKLTEEQRLTAQKRIGSLFTSTIAGKEAGYKICITYKQQVACVAGHTTSQPNTKLGAVKMRDNTNMLCSELAGIGIMDAFDQYNKELANKEHALSNPFSEYEDLTHLHPERLLNYFGPQKNSATVESGWENTPGNVDVSKLLPVSPGFPERTSSNPK